MFVMVFCHAGWLIDGSGAPVQENVLVSIKDGFFDGIRPFFIEPMKPSTFMDLSEYTLLPALADAHVHLFMSGTVDQENPAAGPGRRPCAPVHVGHR